MKKLPFVLIIMALLGSVVGFASAQDDAPPRPDRNRLIGELADIVTDATGLTPQEIRAEMREGATLAEIINANGSDVDTVVSDAVTAITERVETAVANDTITQERADMLLDNLEENIREFLNGERRDNRPDRQLLQRVMLQMSSIIIEETDVTLVELMEAIRDGATPAEVIEANGGNVEAVTDAVVAALTDAINEALDADDISPEAADRLLENLDQQVEAALNGELPAQQRRQNRRG